jgi:AcrR family transcriptional regulator
MPTRPSRTARKKALTDLRRREILDAAIRSFGKKGFAATCVGDIAEAANIAKGTLYLYFDSKEEIYRAAIQLAVQELQAQAAERVAAASGVRDKLAVAIGLRMAFWHEQQALYRLILTVGREPQHRRQTNELTRRAQLSFVAILNDAVATGELHPGPFDAIAWAVFDMIRGANERRLDHISNSTPDQDAATILAFTLRQLGLKGLST